MKRLLFYAVLILVFSSCSKNEVDPDLPQDDTVSEPSLTFAEAQQVRQQALAEWYTEMAARLAENEELSAIHQDDLEMNYAYTIYGEEPEGGHSLWISLHGGGGAPAEVNDEQWANQQVLYHPAEGIYLCPRAPWDAWNMWFKRPIDSLFEELITTMVVLHGVNPDKVYLMGYSAGGDGVWRLAPRLADHWAAAAMMAGHPGDVELVNVRNLPFTLWVGQYDSDYDRNEEVRGKGFVLRRLHNADPDGYVYECHVVPGKGHWMDLEDAAALPWMAQFTRKSYPERIVWQQEEVLRKSFYWLRAPESELERGKKVVVSVNDNLVNIEQCDYSRLTMYFSDKFVDLDKPIKVVKGNVVLFEGSLARHESMIRKTLSQRNDPSYMFDCELTVKIEN